MVQVINTVSQWLPLGLPGTPGLSASPAPCCWPGPVLTGGTLRPESLCVEGSQANALGLASLSACLERAPSIQEQGEVTAASPFIVIDDSTSKDKVPGLLG